MHAPAAASSSAPIDSRTLPRIAAIA